jgi:hypothetical protein
MAAQAWVDDEQACTAGASYDGNLLGQPSLGDALCRAAGSFTAGAPVALDRFRAIKPGIGLARRSAGRSARSHPREGRAVGPITGRLGRLDWR